MAKYSNTVEYNIRTTLDGSGIARLQAELTQLQNKIRSIGSQNWMTNGANGAIADINKVKQALNKAFNPKLGMLNTSAFLGNLKDAGLSLNKLGQDWSKLGAAGQQAFTSMYGQIAKIDTGMRSVSSTTDKIMNTLGNTVRWGLIASGFAAIMNSVHQAAKYVSDLDKSLTNIMMVSGEARDTMNDFAKQANIVAQRLGGTTTQMTEATKIFVQQGLNLEQSSKLAEYSVHLANVSEQDSGVAADEITAYKNAFKIDLDDLGNAISKWAAVANNAAVSVEELSVASQKAASVAKTVGVDMDQFAAHIAAIESTTREAPENIGNGLKTLYSRISDVKLGETLEDGVDLGQFTGALKKIGVEALDSAGELRDAGAIIEDIMARWKDLSQTEKVATATTVAGRFQLARFNALMNSADIYENALNVSRRETGTNTYDRMQETYRESLGGRTKALQASIEEVFLNLFNTDTFYGAVDAVQSLVDTINDLIKATGGGTTALTGIVAVLGRLANKSLAQGISNFIANRQADAMAQKNVQSAQAIAAGQLLGQGLKTDNARLQAFANQTAAVNRNAGVMNDEEIRRHNELITQRIDLMNRLTAVEEAHIQAETQLRTAIAAIDPSLNLTSEELLKQIQEWEMNGIAVSTTSEKFQGLRNIFSSTGSAINQFSEKIRLMSQEGLEDAEILSVLQKNAQTLSSSLKMVANAGGLTAEQLEKLTVAQKLVEATARGDITSTKDLNNALERLQVEVVDINEALSIVPKKMEQMRSEFLKTSSAAAQLAAAEEGVAGAQEMMASTMANRAFIGNITGLANSFMSLVFVMQSFENLSNIWNDDDLDYGEKLKRSLMDVTMIAAMGLPALLQLKDGFAAIGKAIITNAENRLAAAAAAAAETAAVSAETVAEEQNAAATQKNATAELEQWAAEQMGNDVTKTSILLTAVKLKQQGQLTAEYRARVASLLGLTEAELEEMLASRLNTAAQEGENAAKKKGIIANYGLAASTKAVIASMGPMLIISAAIAGVILGIKALVDWYNKDAIAAEKAAETAKQLNEQYQQQKKATEELNTSIANYKEQTAALKEITRGTEEWKEQLHNVNEEVLKLLDKYPKLAKYISQTSDGQLKISQQGLIELQEAQEKALYRSKAEAEMGSVMAASASQKANETYDRRSINWWQATPANYTTGGYMATLSEKQWEQLVTLGTEKGIASLKDSSAIAETLGTSVADPMVQAIINGSDKIAEAVEQRDITKDANNLKVQQSLTDYLKSAGQYDENNPYAAQVVEELAAEISADLDSYKESYQGKPIEDLARDFTRTAEGRGLSFSKKDGDTATFINEEGQEVKYTKEMLVNAFASADAMAAAADKWDDVANKLLGINESTVATDYNAGQAISSGRKTEQGISFNWDKLSDADLQQIGRLDANNLTLADFGLKEETVRNQGFESGKEYIESFINGAQQEYSARNPLDEILDRGVDAEGNDLKKLKDFTSTDSYENPNQSINGTDYDNLNANYQNQTQNLIGKAKDVNDLNNILEKGYITIKDYEDGLITLSQNYADLKSQANDLTEAQKAYEKAIKNYGGKSKEAAKASQELVKVQERLEHSLFEKEWIATAEAISEYNDTLQTAEKDSDEYVQASKRIAAQLSDLMGIDVSEDLVQQHANLVDQWVQGDEAAASSLKALAMASSESNQEAINAAWQALQETSPAIIAGYSSLQDFVASLSFDAHGHADMTEIITALMELDAQGQITEAGMKNLAAWIASIGASNLTFTNAGGETVSIDTSGLDSDDPITKVKALESVLNQISALDLTKGWDITGEVPAGAPAAMAPATGGGTPAGGSGGGGGGGGGSKAKKVKAPESAKSNFDPYEENSAQLSKNEDLLTRIDKTKSRSSGAKWLNMIEDENKALQDQNKILEDRLKINEAEAEALRTGKDNSEYGIYLQGESLAKYGLTDADLDGIVENSVEKYNAALAKQQAAEAAVRAYFEAHGGVMDENGKTITEAEMSEEEEEEFNKLAEAAKEAAEYANGMDSVIKRYNKVSDEIRDNTEKTQENLEKMEDNMIEIYRQTKKASDSLKEMREDAVDTEEALGTLFGDNAAVSLNASQKRLKLLTEGVNPEQLNKAIKKLQDKLANTTDEALQRTYKTQIAALERAAKNGTSVLDLNAQRLSYLMEQLHQYEETGEASDYGKNIAALMEDIEDARKDGVEFAKEMKDRIAEVHQGIQDCLDEIYDAYDAVSAIFDYADDQLDYLGSMTEILYGDKAYAEMEKIARLQAKSGEERLKTLQKTREENHLVLLGLQEGTEEYKKALEKEQELDKQILDTRVNIAESYKTAKENANELAIQDWLSHFQVEVQGTMVPLEYGIDAWERIKENADNYLDDLNRAWETEKLQLKYQQLLNEATDPNIQRQITDQMKEQLDYLREKNNLSKYDVDYANAQLEILQKTIALEDAREAKNQMKLRRDSQGNYSYVYAADQNDIAEKRNELLDAQMNGYNMSVEASVNAQDAFLNKVQNMADQLRTAANDMSITDEQRQAILQDIIQQGYDFLAAQTEQLDTAQVNTIESFIAAAQQLAEENAGAVTQIADELTLRGKDAMELMNATMQNVIGKMITKDEEDNNIPAFRDELIGAVQEIINNVGLFEQAMTEANYNIQDPLSSISDKFTGVSETLDHATASASQFYNFMIETSGVINKNAAELETYQKALADADSKMNQYYNSWKEASQQIEDLLAANANLQAENDRLNGKDGGNGQNGANGNGGKGSGLGGGGGAAGDASDSDTAWRIAQNIWTYGSWGNDPHRHDRITERYGEAIADLTQQYINDYWASGDLVNWASDIWGYATGGYTGSWADSENGRLALLHQKELVLNADDTENILAAVDLVRSFVDSLKAISTPSFGQNYSASMNNIGDTIEQRVQITAEFPGVRSSVEIEQALLNLANNAYQHAYNQNYKTI